MDANEVYSESLEGKSYRTLGHKYGVSHTTIMRNIRKVRDGSFNDTSLLRSLIADYPEHKEWLLSNVPTDNGDKFYSVVAMQNSINHTLPFMEEIYLDS